MPLTNRLKLVILAYTSLLVGGIALWLLGTETRPDEIAAPFDWTTGLLGAGPFIVVAGVFYAVAHLVND